jgi:hypothetical protein
MRYIPPYAATRKPNAPKLTKELKERERELTKQLNYLLPRRDRQVGTTTGGNVWEERGGAQVNECLFQ